jgi:two-component system, NarL family, sensor kinase
VQDLAGLAFALDAAAGRAGSTEAASDVVDAVREGAASARRAMRSLRGTLVDIHPPALSGEGLAAALSDVATPLRSRGVDVRVDVPPDLAVPPEVETLLFRVAQEALRNVAAHADARTVTLSAGVSAGAATLHVADDGRGFGREDRERARERGHMGLRLVEEMVAQAGGRTAVQSGPGAGTRLSVEVPLP